MNFSLNLDQNWNLSLHCQIIPTTILTYSFCRASSQMFKINTKIMKLLNSERTLSLHWGLEPTDKFISFDLTNQDKLSNLFFCQHKLTWIIQTDILSLYTILSSFFHIHFSKSLKFGRQIPSKLKSRFKCCFKVSSKTV